MSANRKVVILAAGKGERLLPLTQSIPKCMLQVGERPLIEHSIEALVSQGATDITIVTGYLPEKLAHLPAMFPQGDIKFLHNQEYATSNNVYSLWLANDLIKNGFMLLNSDIIYHSDILRFSLESDESHIVVDDSKELGEEEMKVMSEGGELRKISKLLDPETSEGEYIGIMSFGPDTAGHMISMLDSMVQAKELDCYYEHAIDRICKEHPVRMVSTRALPWTEIDTHEDLAFAKEEVLPRITAGVSSTV